MMPGTCSYPACTVLYCTVLYCEPPALILTLHHHHGTSYFDTTNTSPFYGETNGEYEYDLFIFTTIDMDSCISSCSSCMSISEYLSGAVSCDLPMCSRLSALCTDCTDCTLHWLHCSRLGRWRDGWMESGMGRVQQCPGSLFTLHLSLFSPQRLDILLTRLLRLSYLLPSHNL